VAYPVESGDRLSPPVFRSVDLMDNSGLFEVSMQMPMQPDGIQPYASSDGKRYYLVTIYVDDVSATLSTEPFVIAEGQRASVYLTYTRVAGAILSATASGESAVSSVADYSEFLSFVPKDYVIHISRCRNIVMSNCKVDGRENGIMFSDTDASMSDVEMTLPNGGGYFVYPADNPRVLQYNVRKAYIE